MIHIFPYQFLLILRYSRPPLAPLRGHRLQQAAAGGLGAATLAAGSGGAGHDGTTAGATR